MVTGWSWLRTRLRDYSAQLRLCLRVTAAALLAFVLAQPLDVPLSGLWAVLTAIVVTQISVGGSLQATTEYVTGTLGGAIYASVIALLVPHTTVSGVAAGLALTLAPLAFLAAVSPRFRVAPFTAVLVLLVSAQLGEGPITAALYRLLEVAIGGIAAIVVSLVVLPQRAHGLVIEAAACVLDLMAQALPELLAGLTRPRDESAVRQPYSSEMAALRSEGATRELASSDVERIFALGFALEQLYRNFLDLERCVRDCARTARRGRREHGKADVEDSLG